MFTATAACLDEPIKGRATKAQLAKKEKLHDQVRHVNLGGLFNLVLKGAHRVLEYSLVEYSTRNQKGARYSIK